MNLLKIKLNHHRFNHRHQLCQNSQITPNLSPHFLFHPSQKQKSNFSVSYTPLIYSFTKYAKASAIHSKTPFFANEKIEEEEESKDFEEYLAEDGEVYQKTLRLVECAMFSAVSGLAFLLSNSLAIEVATAVLLFVLSGPVKAITYLLLHGLLGFAMGTSWRSQASWSTSVFLCSFVRAVGAIGYVLISSFLIGENILNLITINIHALLTYMLTSFGFNAIPSMNLIYFIFGFLVCVICGFVFCFLLAQETKGSILLFDTRQLLLNCAFFVFLLHLLYAVFFTRLGMKDSLKLPKWLAAAI